MLDIGNTRISLDVLQEKFTCNPSVCKGACCVTGDSGAPLEIEEADILSKMYPVLRPFVRMESVKTIEETGTSVIDMEDDIVTPLNNGKECVYVLFEDGIARCAIEKAYNEGVISFRKPVSCHLYPVRIKKYPMIEAVNYDRWDICQAAPALGKDLNMPVYLFVQDALQRKYGIEWFNLLKVAAANLKIEKLSD
jgi:hypothetical protein